MLLLVATALAACQPMPASDAQVPAPAPQQSSASAAGGTDATACAAQGGKMLPQGRMQTERCVIAYADAGKRCTDGDDCLGDCRIGDVAGAPAAGTTAVGQCHADSSRFGCYTTVEDGKAEATICVD
ncbi:hypothetical protein [Brevundimonas lenta]|uniref:Putative hemolysin n=1 Tax=Brevundimonas lenta TaxID=424796 RepID=A0A7W6JFH7_9CAUL|nr:hypothetical protein [Brevundimonas lenta]MBB4084194.1 putative hemolysin [Brevundimonas lenta]